MPINTLRHKVLTMVFIIIFALISEEVLWSGQAKFQKIVYILCAVVGIYTSLRKKTESAIRKSDEILHAAYIPIIFILLYTIMICSISGAGISGMKQAISTSAFIIVDMMMVAALLYWFKEKVVDVVCTAVLLSFLLTIIGEGLEHGFWELVINYTNPVIGANSWLERSDIGTAVVVFILYYLWEILNAKKGINIGMIIREVLLIGVLLLAGKRIAVVGLFIGIVSMLMFRFFKEKKTILKCFVVGTPIILYLYLFIIQSGILGAITEAFYLPTSGRIYVWSHFSNQYSLLPDYLGKGFQYIRGYMEWMTWDGIINGFGMLHNMVLQLYIECGFFGFFFYFIYMLGIYPKKIWNLCGDKAKFFYISLILATFGIYIADNVLTYPVYQVSLYSCIVGFVYKEIKKNEC